MTETINLQYNVFLLFMFVGAWLGFIYDVIRCFRRLMTHNNIFIGIEDIVFWMFCAITIESQIQISNYGEFRIYILLSCVLGFIIYHYTISCVFVKGTSHILLFVKKVLKNLKKMLKNIVKRVKIIVSVKRNR